MRVVVCESEASIRAAFPVMKQLRENFTEESFVETVSAMMKQGYVLSYLEDEGQVRGAVGLRCGQSLAWGRYAYIDDLVTASDDRSRGHGKRLLDWAEDYGRKLGCAELHLDSGVQRFSAHRFYLRERMDIVFHHFRRMIRS